VAERWTAITENLVTEESIIAFGLDGSLEFVIHDGEWNKTSQELNIYPSAENGTLPYCGISLSIENLKQIRRAKSALRLKKIFDDISLDKQLNNSRNRFATMDCLHIPKQEVMRYEQQHLGINHQKNKSKTESIESKRIKVVEQYLSENQSGRIKMLTLQGVWAELAQKDKKLFRPLSDRTIGDLFTSCRKAGVNFPKLKAGLRKNNH